MKSYEIPHEPVDGIWSVGPFLGDGIEFWYGESELKDGFFLDPDWLNIYIINSGEGSLRISGEERGIELKPKDAVIVDNEHYFQSDEMHATILRAPKPKFSDYSFIHAGLKKGKWCIGNWIGSPIELGHDKKSRVYPEKDDIPHYHKKLQEGYLTKSGKALLKGISDGNESMLELSAGTLVTVEPNEEHAIVNVINSPYNVVLFNYPSPSDDKYVVKWE